MSQPNEETGIWIQRVHGTTLVHVTGENPCGVEIKDGMLNLRYEISITAASLCPRGFVLDNREVMGYFEQMTEISSSCEELAMLAALHFFVKLEARGQRSCASVSVKIWGGERASLEYTWPKPVK